MISLMTNDDAPILGKRNNISEALFLLDSMLLLTHDCK